MQLRAAKLLSMESKRILPHLRHIKLCFNKMTFNLQLSDISWHGMCFYYLIKCDIGIIIHVILPHSQSEFVFSVELILKLI